MTDLIVLLCILAPEYGVRFVCVTLAVGLWPDCHVKPSHSAPAKCITRVFLDFTESAKSERAILE
jgi:hypothetical protein